MIGLIAQESEMGFAREFFELFKTPWEPWTPNRTYEVVICASKLDLSEVHARLIVVYSGSKLPSDAVDNTELSIVEATRYLSHGNECIPVYGRCITFSDTDCDLLVEHSTGRSAAFYIEGDCNTRILRVGYDLFQEVATLLIHGQPPSEAGIPTLDLHIDFLRAQIQSAGIEILEIPPIPYGYRFIVCLTHDIDHPAIRRHRCDHTAAGFLYRGTIRTLINLLRRRMPLKSLIKNWFAVARWPLIQVGLARDFWADFHQQYRELESGLPATYFVIPFAGMSGRSSSGMSHLLRATKYGARDIVVPILKILKDGCEIGLHGIDAWLDSESGVQELDEIRKLTGNSVIGVRMHWLFFDESSPRKLDYAGACYDSTFGYRQTVGYRAGTTQAYIPPGAESLIELPLHVMDTALFYPTYLNLTPDETDAILTRLLDNAERFGGCLIINWQSSPKPLILASSSPGRSNWNVIAIRLALTTMRSTSSTEKSHFCLQSATSPVSSAVTA